MKKKRKGKSVKFLWPKKRDSSKKVLVFLFEMALPVLVSEACLQPPEYWDYKHVPPCLAVSDFLRMVGRHCI